MTQEAQSRIKGCYFYYQDIQHGKGLDGVGKKVTAQIGAFNNAGYACDFILCEQPESVESKVLSCLPFASDGVRWPHPESLKEYSFIYIRRPRFFSKDLTLLLKETKRRSPDIKIIVEVPTYPYDSEMKSPLLYPALIKDRISRKELQAFVNRVSTPAIDKEIFGVETIYMMNGIDLSSILQKEPAPSLDEVHIIAVASFSRWHGLDRFISGMTNYYRESSSQRNIVLHVAGEGSEIEALKKQAKAAGLTRQILFHGYCGQEALGTLYNRCSLAIECLGLHRKGVLVSSALKSREYLAKGIPFICANEIDVFIDNPVDFCLRVPSDETPVDIESLLRFHDQLYQKETQESLIKRIRVYAESHVGINQTMQSVIDFIAET